MILLTADYFAGSKILLWRWKKELPMGSLSIPQISTVLSHHPFHFWIGQPYQLIQCLLRLLLTYNKSLFVVLYSRLHDSSDNTAGIRLFCRGQDWCNSWLFLVPLGDAALRHKCSHWCEQSRRTNGNVSEARRCGRSLQVCLARSTTKQKQWTLYFQSGTINN